MRPYEGDKEKAQTIEALISATWKVERPSPIATPPTRQSKNSPMKNKQNQKLS